MTHGMLVYNQGWITAPWTTGQAVQVESKVDHGNGRAWSACPSVSEAEFIETDSLEKKDEDVFSNTSTLPGTLEDWRKLSS